MKRILLSLLASVSLAGAEPQPVIIQYDSKTICACYEGDRKLFVQEIGTTNAYLMDKVIPRIYTNSPPASTNQIKEVKFFRAVAR